MHIKTFWIVLFVFSIFVYGSPLKKIGKINNFNVQSSALLISNDNILINPYFQYDVKSKPRELISKSINFYDIRDIMHPKVLNSISLNNHSIKIDISKDKKYLFVLQDTLKIYNIENIKNPKLVASYYIDNPGNVFLRLSKKRNYLYITKPLSKTPIRSRGNNYAFFVYDITDLNNIRLVSKKSIEFISNIWISPNEKKLFYTLSRLDSKIIPDKQIGLADISDIKHIKVVDESWRYFVGRGSHASVRSAFFSQDDKYLYIASGTYGVMVYDVSHNTLDLVQRTAGRKVLKFLNCTGGIYDIEYDKAFDRFFLIGVDEDRKNLEKITYIKGIKESYFVNGSSSFAIDSKKLLLVNDYDFRNGKTIEYVDIYGW